MDVKAAVPPSGGVATYTFAISLWLVIPTVTVAYAGDIENVAVYSLEIRLAIQAVAVLFLAAARDALGLAVAAALLADLALAIQLTFPCVRTSRMAMT